MQCPKCNSENIANAKFCRECGSTLEAIKQVTIGSFVECPKCGNSIESSKKFCPKCGTSKAEAEEIDQQRIKVAEEQRAFLEEKERIAQDRKDNIQFWIDQHGGKSRIILGCGLVAILLATIAIWHFESPDKKVISSNALEPMLQSNHANNSTTNPQSTSSTANPKPEPTRTMMIATSSGGVITVKDFIHNGVTQPDKSNAGNYFLAANAPGCLEYMPGCHVGSADDFIVYYFGAGQLFNISLEKDPLRQSRLHAENFMLHTLGITKQQMCNLNYRVGVTVYVNSEYAGPNLGFSFCPGATELPTQPGPHAVPRSG